MTPVDFTLIPYIFQDLGTSLISLMIKIEDQKKVLD